MCPHADFWGERELSRIIRELKEMGLQADYDGRQQEQLETTDFVRKRSLG